MKETQTKQVIKQAVGGFETLPEWENNQEPWGLCRKEIHRKVYFVSVCLTRIFLVCKTSM